MIKVTDFNNTFASSDHHFYHNNVIKYCSRPFKDIEEMNEKLVVAWNSVVKPNNTVYYLGDFSMAFRAVELFTKRLNGKKILFAGNHDFCHTAHKKSRQKENQKVWVQKYIDNGWSEVLFTEQIDIEGVAKVNINHLPYRIPNDPYEDTRYTTYRTTDDGLWLLCGHVHEKWAQRNKMINVGVDVRNFKPISFKEIASIINAEPNGYPVPNYSLSKKDY